MAKRVFTQLLVKVDPARCVYVCDRIEVISVGGMLDGLKLGEFYEGKSKPVNLEFQQIMVQLDYMKQTEHEVLLIVSKFGKEVFDITENFIAVTIPLNKEKKKKRLRERKMDA